MKTPSGSALPLWRRFHVRLSVVYGGLVFAVVAVVCAAVYVHLVRTEFAALQARMQAVADASAVRVNGAKARYIAESGELDFTYYRRMMLRFEEECAGDPDVVSMYVLVPTEQKGILRFAADYVKTGTPGRPGALYDARGFPKMLAGLTSPQVEDHASTDAWGTLLSAYAPVTTRDGKPVAVLGVDVELTRIERMKRDVLMLSLALFAACAGVLSLIALAVGRNVRAPLESVTRAAERIAQGHFDARVALHRDDEFGLLGKSFDAMASGLEERERIRRTFGRYVSEDVARRVLEGEGDRLGGEEREVTVLFSDLRNYSTISEPLSPSQVVSLLNEYLAAMQVQVDENGGVVIEFLGDAILAVFGAPGPLEHHAEKAVRCAIGMRDRLTELNREWEARGLAKLWLDRGLERFGARIGVHSGRVVAGNLGSATRVKYAVIGDAVNLASRVETLNGQLGTDVLVTGAAFERLPDDLRARATDRGEHLVKGRKTAVRVYSF